MTTEEALVLILVELRNLRGDLAERVGSSSSVEIKSSTRGNDVAVKSYAGSDVQAAGEAAVDEYVRVVADLNQKLAGALNGKPA